MDQYDLIVIGSGPGGASLAHRLAPTGKRILLLERGDYLPRSIDNWSSQVVFVDGRYQAPETWYGTKGDEFHPGLHYYVGDNSKVFGAALFRLRERDFEQLQHVDGISPEWPLKYADFEPFYIRCDAFDGFPCLFNGKADAQVMCVDPALADNPNLTLITHAYVSKLETSASNREVSSVVVQRHGAEERYSADIIVVACGALSAALLLLRSANDAHPNGLANGSGQVGRNYIRHNQSVLMALLKEPNETVFQKTLAVSDYCFGADDWQFPLGLIQMCASSHADQIKSEALPSWLEWLPDKPFDAMARHSMGFWLSSEDLPRPENRIYYDGDRVVLDLNANNIAGARPVLLERRLYLGTNFSLAGGFLLLTFGSVASDVPSFFAAPFASTHPYAQVSP